MTKIETAYHEHTTNPKYAHVLAEAASRGFRLAEPWERSVLDNKDLYSWRGTVWVRA